MYLSMGIKNNRLWILLASCGAVGIVLGGTASWAQTHQCLQMQNLTSDCLTQDPAAKTLEGMSMGLLAGIGAAVGAALQIRRQGD